MCVFDYNNKLKGMSSVAALSYENHEEGKQGKGKTGEPSIHK